MTMLVDKRRFLIILIASLAIFTSFIIIVPTPIAKKLGILELPVVHEFRNRFNLDRNTEIILVGDIMLGRSVMVMSQDLGDPTYPFRKVAFELGRGDIALANLENPLVNDCPRRTEGLVFCASPEAALGLTFASIDVVSLSNNHTKNYGLVGLEQTQDVLSQNKIKYSINDRLETIEKNGLTFGFLSFDKSQQSNPTLSEAEGALMRQSDSKVDVLIVSMHWGVEYQDISLPGVKTLARQLVDLGADVVHGHHPHWVQDIEYINGKPVYYSLGNFVFDQMWSEKTKEGLMIKLTLDSEGNFVKDEKVNVYIEEVGQPKFVSN